MAAGAAVGGDLVAVGSEFEAAPGFAPDGEQVVVGPAGLGNTIVPTLRWISEGLLMGRPIVPTLGWVWVVVALLAAVYFAINLIFERPVRACSEFLEQKPLTAGLTGVLALVLVTPVSLLLALSLVGAPLIPFLWFALLLAGVFGRVSVARWLGCRMVAEEPPGGTWPSSRSLLLGLAVICVAYMIPVIGLVAWFSMGILGLGAVTATAVAGLRREYPSSARPAVSVPASKRVKPDECSAAAPAGSYQVASFLPRLGAVLLDMILVTLCTVPFDIDVELVIVIFLAYHVAFCAWKSTTVGGIVCQLRVVRSDGAPRTFADALVRGLASIFSAAVVGLGWVWALWDPARQSWHDKIAKTYVVRAQDQSMPPAEPEPGTSDPFEAPSETDALPAADVPQEPQRKDQ